MSGRCSGRNVTIGEPTGDIKIRREVKTAESGSARQKDVSDSCAGQEMQDSPAFPLGSALLLASPSWLLDWNACMSRWSLDLVRLANTQRGNGCCLFGVEKQPVVDELAIIAPAVWRQMTNISMQVAQKREQPFCPPGGSHTSPSLLLFFLFIILLLLLFKSSWSVSLEALLPCTSKVALRRLGTLSHSK